VGGGSVDLFPYQDKKEEAHEEVNVADLLDKLCPDYMAMGMTYDEYWNGDAELPRFYREAHRLRRIQENHNAWLHGLYVYHAMSSVSPLFRDLVKDHTAEKYLEQPFDLYPEPKKPSTEQQEQDAKDLANQAMIKDWVKRANRLYEEKHSKEGKANAG